METTGTGTARSSMDGSPAPSSGSAGGAGGAYTNGLFLSAPGKIILFGEHAVVYGRTAIAGAIDLRTYVSLYTSADGVIYLSLPDLGVEKTWLLKDLLKAADRLADGASSLFDDEDGAPPQLEVVVPVARKLSGACEDQCGVQHLAVLAFWYLLLGVAQRKRDLPAVKVTIRFKLPSCVGLGSSGAYCVCIAASLLQAAGMIPPPAVVACTENDMGGETCLTWEQTSLDLIRRWAVAAESLIHGRASGIDAAICTYGGVASFKPGARIQHIKNIPDLKVILVNSKVERNTSRMVSTVKEKLKRYPDVVEPIFNAIDGVSREAIALLDRADCEASGGAGGGGAGGGNEPGSNSADHGVPVMLAGTSALNSTAAAGAGARSACGSGANANANATALCNEDEHEKLQASHAAGGGAGVGSAHHTPRSVTSLAAARRSIDATRAQNSTDVPPNAAAADVNVYARLNDLCRMNNQLLIALGVGHPKIDQISTLLARYGIHPKMTGAGGGGSVYAFLKPDTSQTVLEMIRGELTKLGYELWQPPLGGNGVLSHPRRPDLFRQPSTSQQAQQHSNTAANSRRAK